MKGNFGVYALLKDTLVFVSDLASQTIVYEDVEINRRDFRCYLRRLRRLAKAKFSAFRLASCPPARRSRNDVEANLAMKEKAWPGSRNQTRK
jgi:hypothetical protein